MADQTSVYEYLDDLSMAAKPVAKVADFLPPTPFTKVGARTANAATALGSAPGYLLRFGLGYHAMTKPEQQPIRLVETIEPIRVTTPLAEVEIQARQIRSFDRLSINDLKTLRAAIVAALDAQGYDRYTDNVYVS